MYHVNESQLVLWPHSYWLPQLRDYHQFVKQHNIFVITYTCSISNRLATIHIQHIVGNAVLLDVAAASSLAPNNSSPAAAVPRSLSISPACLLYYSSTVHVLYVPSNMRLQILDVIITKTRFINT
jgi:hypothetical protein